MTEHDSLSAAYDAMAADHRDQPEEPASPARELVSTIGANLRQLRARNGFSLEKLAALSGVSRGMIGQIENGKSTPTVALLARLAEALGVELLNLLVAQQVPVTKVLRRAKARTVQASSGKFVARSLSRPPLTGVEFFEVALARGHFEEGQRQPAGTWAHIAVASGIVTVTIAGEPATTLAAGDAMIFSADSVHGFHNVGDDEAVIYTVLSNLSPRA